MSTAATFELAVQAEAIAGPIIAEHHIHLARARILFLFTSATRTTKGQLVLATASKLTARERFFTSGALAGDPEADPYDFLILIGQREWSLLTHAERIALVDHELSHCIDDGGVWAVRGHDVEEFRELIERRGLWNPSLQLFGGAVVRQLGFDEPAPHLAEALS